jgi:hypothetical protein
MENPKLHVPAGHYYSPIPSNEDINFSMALSQVTRIGEIDLNRISQINLRNLLLDKYNLTIYSLINDATNFELKNTWFSGSDAITSSLLLQHLKPKRILEIGSGYSTALISDLNLKFFSNLIEFTTVDPNAERVKLLNLNVNLISRKVQNLGIEHFSRLQTGDILFIDSSHVIKAGSDLAYLFFEVFPILNVGVKIHFHDIFYPFEYPENWLKSGVAFNEIYGLRLFLQNSINYQIYYWNDFLEKTDRDWFEKNMPLCLESRFPTGGIWIEKII